MTDNEKLIEEAAKAIRQLETDGILSGDLPDFEEMARAALAVFEKALGEATVTPTAHEVTSDERWLNNLSYAATTLEASADNGDRYCARLIREHLAAAGFRRSEVPEPSADDAMSHYTDPADPFWQSSPELQGEPSDAQVGAAMNAVVTYYQEQGHLTRPESVDYQALRAALRAAMSLREGGVQ